MRPIVRGVAGVAVGGGALLLYLWVVGFEDVLARLGSVPAAAVALALVLVVLEGVVDGIGVWASVRPLNGGLDGGRSVLFALAGDFFDTVSPAGAASSEPIMARFFAVATDTGYSDALGVRSLAKYVKAAAQLVASGVLAVLLVFAGPVADSVALTLGGALVVLAVAGTIAVVFRGALTRAVVFVMSPVVTRVSALYRETPLDPSAVAAAVERFRERIGEFRHRPDLLALIALGGLLEQGIYGVAYWSLFVATGVPVALLPIVVVVPLPQAASLVPIPASIGTYDLVMVGALLVATGVTAAAATPAVLVVRTLTVCFAVAVGGLSVTFLRGWRPGAA